MPLRPLLRPVLALGALVLTVSCGGSDGGGPTGPDPNVVTSVSVSPPSATLDVGETVQLSATATNSQGGAVNTPVSWSSSAPGVATVSASGLVTGVGAGAATITATAGGRSATTSVTVLDPTPPDAPSALTAAPATDTEVELAWTDGSDNETGFEVEREPVAGAASASGTASFEAVATVGAGVTSFRDSGLEAATAYRYRVRAVNANGASDYTSSAEVTTWATLLLETESLPAATLNQAYTASLGASGGAGAGTFAWSLTGGTLPAGLSLSEEGVLSGTPTATGTASVEITVTSGGQSVARSFDLAVVEEIVAPQVVTTALPDARVGVAYSEVLEASGGDGTYAWTLTSGSFPAGLSLAADGTVSGTPTVEGDATVTVEVTSAGLTGSGQVSVSVLLESLEVTTTSVPDGEVGVSYSTSLASSGGVAPITWSLESGALPAGLSLSDDGTISGSPSLAETTSFTVKATSSDAQEATASLELTVNPGPVSISTGDLDGGQVGTPYSLTLEATGGDGLEFAWSLVTGLPPSGVTLSPSGVLSGTPGAEGTFEFTVRASSGGLARTKQLILTTIPQPQPGYQVELVYLTNVSPGVRAVFESAKDRWSELITGDEPDEPGGVPACGSFFPATQADVDDVVIYVSVEEIDGAGGTLGQASPCWIRDVGSLPVAGAMAFDEADLNNLLNNNLLSPVILHEMGHVLGIGVIWNTLGLRSGQCLEDPIFTGAGAIQAFNDADGTFYSGEPVPIENGGALNDGSNCSHWRENVLGSELMTPFISAGTNPLSAITVESLGDMGYTVDASVADAYELPKPVPAGAPALRSGLLLHNDLLRIPLRRLGPGGRALPVRGGR